MSFIPVAMAIGGTELAVLALLGLSIALLLFSQRDRRRAVLAWRLDQLERKIDLILEHLQIAYKDDLTDRVLDLLAAGQKIGAIKTYREATGVGLKDAKDAVDAIEANRRASGS